MNYRMAFLVLLVASAGVALGSTGPSIMFRAPNDGETTDNKVKFCFNAETRGILAYANVFTIGSCDLTPQQIDQLARHMNTPTMMTVKQDSKGPLQVCDVDKQSFRSALKCRPIFDGLNTATQNKIKNIQLLSKDSDTKLWTELEIVPADDNKWCLDFNGNTPIEAKLLHDLNAAFDGDYRLASIGLITSTGAKRCISRERLKAIFASLPQQQEKSSTNGLWGKLSKASWSQLCMVGGASLAVLIAAICYFRKK